MTERAVKIWTWVARVATFLSLAAGALASATDVLSPGAIKVLALAVSILTLFVGWIRGFLPAVKSRIVPAALLVFAAMLMLSAGCKATSYDVAVRSVRGLQQVRDLTGKQLATVMRTTHAECKAKHGAKTKEFADCVKPVLGHHDNWRKYVRPIMDTTAESGKAALTTTAIVEKCKKEKNCDKVLLKILAPGACAIMRGVKAFGHLFADKGSAVLTALKPFEGVACAK